jgi:hypothetical protein
MKCKTIEDKRRCAMDKKNKEMGPGMMMGMMKEMMGGWEGMPSMMEKCIQMPQQMAGAIEESLTATVYGTSEIKALFEDWAKAVEEEILSFVREKGSCEPAEIAAKLKISEESAAVFISRLIRGKKIRITCVTAS